MKVYNPKFDNILHDDLFDILNKYREYKNLDINEYINAKATILNNYMNSFNLKSCVIGVSGGIDSAVVLGIVNYAKNLPNSPIEKIVPVSLPVYNSGATGQKEATERALEYISQLNLDKNVIKLSEAHSILDGSIENTLNIESKDWAKGQLVSYVRTPTLYYMATLLTQEGLPAIIVGTTNRDEGLYLGYFGKASDGLVDIQLISDLHKNEVYMAAKALNVSQSIIDISPQGDMYDGRIDEEVFGAPYDFVELYLNYLSESDIDKNIILNNLPNDAKEQFNFLSGNLENLHKYNRHKYFSASPAIHLDIDVLNIPEGWKTNCNLNLIKENEINFNNFNGYFEMEKLNFSSENKMINIKKENIYNSEIIILDNVLSSTEINDILNNINNQKWVEADKYGKTKKETNETKSLRLGTYNTDLKKIIEKRIFKFIPNIKLFTDEIPLIADNKKIWTKDSINPYFRFIRYNNNHSLVAHYDDTHVFNEYKRTLMSVIIYLEDSDSETRFLKDDNQNKKDSERDYSDKNENAKDEDVLFSVKSKAGQVVIFDHRLLHDATSPNNKQKTIIRTDITYSSPNYGFKF